MTEAASNELLGWIIRVVGLMWLIGAFVLVNSLRRDAMLDGMISKLDRIATDLAGEGKPKDAAEAWIDRDERNRRRWLGAQAVLLGVTGLSMAILSRFSVYLVAALIAAQGVYFLVREMAVRAAPTDEAREDARPSRSTVNAGWFSVAVGGLVWLASSRHVLE